MDISTIKLLVHQQLDALKVNHLHQLMGYSNKEHFQQKLDVILGSEFLGLDGGFYDFNGSTSVFLQDLLRHLKLDQPEILDVLESTHQKLSHHYYDQPHIKALWRCEGIPETQKLRGLGRMALGNRLQIKVPFSIQNDDAAFAQWLGEMIPGHLCAVSKEFGRYGRIDGYLYCKSPTEQYEVDLMGRVLIADDVMNNKL
jgi:hypothetical protein